GRPWSGEIDLFDERAAGRIELVLGPPCGGSRSATPDLDGDGVPDLVLGSTSSQCEGPSSRIEVFLGLGEIRSDGRSADVVIRGDPGTITSGKFTNGPGTLGYDLAASGDTNGDGVGDLAIGSFMGATGEVFLLLGTRDISEWHDDASILDYEEASRVVRFRTTSWIMVGEIVSGGFDFNGDGLGDFAVGARSDGRDYHGAVFIVLGSEKYGEEIRNVQLDEESELVVRFPGPFPNDELGQAVGLGDFNADG